MGWHTSEQGELSGWWKALKRYGGTLPGSAVDFQPNHLEGLFARVTHIRNHAVHRNPVTNDTIRTVFLPDAMLLLVGVKDISRQKQLAVFNDAVTGQDGIPNISRLQQLLGL